MKKLLLLLTLLFLSVGNVLAQRIYPETFIDTTMWSPDGRLIVSAEGTHVSPTEFIPRLYIYNADGTLAHDLSSQLTGYTGHPELLGWQPGPASTHVAVSVFPSADILIWNARTGQIDFTIPWAGRTFVNVAWSPDGSLLAGVSYDEMFVVWQFTGKEYRQIAATPMTPVTTYWLSDNQVLTAGTTGALLWTVTANGLDIHLPTNRIDGQQPVDFAVSSVGILSNGQDILLGGVLIDVVGNQTPTLVKYNRQSGAAVTLPFTTHSIFFDLSADGTRASVLNTSSVIKVYDVASGQEIGRYTQTRPGGTVRAAWSPDGTRLAYGSSRNDLLPPDIVIVDVPLIHEIVTAADSSSR